MSQTSYAAKCAVGYAGLIADLQPHKIIARINNDASAAIEFGRAVQNIPGENDNCELVDATGDKILGLSVHKHNESGKYAIGDSVSIMREGVMWVLVDDTVVEHGIVYVKHSTGELVAADDGANTSALTNARWYESRTGAGLVRVELGSNISAMT